MTIRYIRYFAKISFLSFRTSPSSSLSLLSLVPSSLKIHDFDQCHQKRHTLIPSVCFSSTDTDTRMGDDDRQKHHKDCDEKVSHGVKTKLNIILLQHEREQYRSTSTALILNDFSVNVGKNNNSFNMHINQTKNISRSNVRHVDMKKWIWSGRKDNPLIEQKLHTMRDMVYLVWVGNNSSAVIDNLHNHSAIESDSTNNNDATKNIEFSKNNNAERYYLILDGTWKEAKTMHRKMPFLHSLPRVSLTASLLNSAKNKSWKSSYILRKDYTGWREKFSKYNEESMLPCTAEVVAALLHINGNFIGCDAVLDRLRIFQKDHVEGGGS